MEVVSRVYHALSFGEMNFVILFKQRPRHRSSFADTLGIDPVLPTPWGLSFAMQNVLNTERGHNFGMVRERSQPDRFLAARGPVKRQFQSPSSSITSGEGSSKKLRVYLNTSAPSLQDDGAGEIDGASSGCPGMLTGSGIAIVTCDVHHQRRGGADGRAGHGRCVARRLGKDDDATASSSDPVAVAPKQLQKRGLDLRTFEVDCIIASRLNALGDEEYRVRWKGFSEKDDTWEPAENFLPGVVEEFKAFVSSSDTKYYRTCPKCRVSVTPNNMGKHFCSESKKTETCPKCERTFFRSHFESHRCGGRQEEVASKGKAAVGAVAKAPQPLDDSSDDDEEAASKQVATVEAKPTFPSPVPSAVRLCT